MRALEYTKMIQDELTNFLDAEDANITDEKIEQWLSRLTDCEFRSGLYDKLMGWKSVMNELKNIKKLKRDKTSIKTCIANLRRILADNYRNEEIESLLEFFESRKTWYENSEKILNKKTELTLVDIITNNGREFEIHTDSFLKDLILDAEVMLIPDQEIFSLQHIQQLFLEILQSDERVLENLIEKVRSQFALGIADTDWEKRCQILRSRLNFKINAESIFRLFGEDTSKFKELDHSISQPVVLPKGTNIEERIEILLNNEDYKNLAQVMGLEEYRKLEEYKETLEGWKLRAESALGDQNEELIDSLLEEAMGKPFDKGIQRKLEREREFLGCVRDSKEIVGGRIVVDESFMDGLDALEDEMEELELEGEEKYIWYQKNTNFI